MTEWYLASHRASKHRAAQRRNKRHRQAKCEALLSRRRALAHKKRLAMRTRSAVTLTGMNRSPKLTGRRLTTGSGASAARIRLHGSVGRRNQPESGSLAV